MLHYRSCRLLALFLTLLSLLLCRVECGATDKKIAAFNRWLDQESARVPCKVDCPLLKVHVGETKGMGVGVVEAPYPIRTRSIILTLPVNATFCEESIQERHGPLFSQLGAAIRRGNEELIAVALLVERALVALGVDSPFAAYLDVVPEVGALSAAYLWPVEAIRRIEPFHVRDHVLSTRKGMLDDYRAFASRRSVDAIRNYLASKSGVAVSQIPESLFLSEALYLWGRNMVDSRAWNMHGKKFLVPGADFFNHKEDHEDLTFDYRKNYYGTPVRSSKFLETHRIGAAIGGAPSLRVMEVRSDRSGTGTAGAQLFESYGDSSNEIYMTYHGFVPSRNLYDCEPFLEMSAASSQQQPQHSPGGTKKRCVHLGEMPPSFLFSALAATSALPSSIGQCVARYPSSGTSRTFQSEQQRWKQVVASCLCDRHPNGRTYGHAIVTSLHQHILQQAKKRFTTLNTTEDDAALREVETDERDAVHPVAKATTALFRRGRRQIVKKLLQSIQKEAKTAESTCDGQTEL